MIKRPILGESKALVFLRVLSFYSHALLSASNSGQILQNLREVARIVGGQRAQSMRAKKQTLKILHSDKSQNGNRDNFKFWSPHQAENRREKVKLDRNADNFGRDFGREFSGGLEPWRNKAEQSRQKFAEKLAGNSPESCHTKCIDSPETLQNLGINKLLSNRATLIFFPCSFGKERKSQKTDAPWI